MRLIGAELFLCPLLVGVFLLRQWLRHLNVMLDEVEHNYKNLRQSLGAFRVILSKVPSDCPISEEIYSFSCSFIDILH